MDLRMLEVVAPSATIKEARQRLADEPVIGMWQDNLNDGQGTLRVLLKANETEDLTDMLSEQFGETDDFRLMLSSVEATVPQPEETEEQKKEQERISREELHADIADKSNLNGTYLAMAVLSTLVATVGLVNDDVTAIIGAMVIAPLMGPNVAMALAVTLADSELGWQSVKTNMCGLGLVVAVAFIIGLVLPFDPSGQQLMNINSVSFGDLVISIAAGAAGVLAFTVGVPATIIGVAVALALLPALVSLGLLLGGGYYQLAAGAFILSLTNIISINLAGVVTFLVQGIRPRSWWEEQRAKKASRIALAIWVVLLGILITSIWYWGTMDLQTMLQR